MSRFDDLPPSNDEFKGKQTVKSGVRLCYPCRKCGRNIWAHLINEHIKFCGKRKKYTGPKAAATSSTMPIKPGPKEKRRLVDVTIRSTRTNRSRYRR